MIGTAGTQVRSTQRLPFRYSIVVQMLANPRTISRERSRVPSHRHMPAGDSQNSVIASPADIAPTPNAAPGSTRVPVARASKRNRRVTHRTDTDLENAPRRTRFMELDRLRVSVAALSVVALAGAWSAVSVWNTHDREARLGAAAAMAFVDARLNEVDSEMMTLASHPLLAASWQRCDASLSSLLARQSTASNLVQRFVLSVDGEDVACRPDGAGAALYLPFDATERLSLTSTGEISPRLTAARRLGGARVMVAVLDPRAFEPRASEPSAWSTSRSARFSLLSVDGRRLATLGEQEARGPLVASLRSITRSPTRDVMVSAEIEEAALRRMAWQRAPLAIASALLLLAAFAGWCWRRSLLRSRLYYRIERGLVKREFVPFVQPIVDLTTGRCAGAEVLMRWNHPHRGTLPPSEFIEEAERTGLIVGMSDLVMARAARQLSAIAKQRPDLYFSFNITPQQLAHRQLPQRLDELFQPDTLAQDRVLLELTERDFVDPVSTRRLNALQDSGWRVAIDDFGTGHSSLSSLEQLQIDRLKIDRAFVSTIGEETASRPVLDAIITLADQLQVAMIAEGVETQAQWDYLASRGVQYAQGYLIARPMSIDAFAEWIETQETPALAGASVRGAAASMGPALRRASAHPQDAFAQQLWNSMRTPGGLDIRDRMFHLRTYKECFVGREAVDWLVLHQRVSRADAVRLGQRLVALGLMSHVVTEHDFEDAELFYRLSSPAVANLAAGPAAADLAEAFRGADGVRLSDHVRGLIRHRDCVTGAAIVDWFVATYRVQRATAVQWAATLMRQGVLRHVFDDRPFRDDRTLYRPG
jgi:EAL domain-containing protein (putative c-di-GMP-specific phosphodiesterase class I)